MHTLNPTLNPSDLEQARIRSCGRLGVLVTPLTARNDQAVSEWLEWLRRSAGRTDQTVRDYAGVWAHYLDHCVGNHPLDGVSVESIEAWLLRPRAKRAKGRTGAAATRARNIAILRSGYRWLVGRGYCQTDPTTLLVAPKVRNRSPKAIGDRTLRVALGAAHTANDGPMVAILVAGAFLGLRRAEIASLTGEQVTDTQLVGFVRKGGGEDVMDWADLADLWAQRAPELVEPIGGADGIHDAMDWIRHNDGIGLPSPDAVNRRLKDHLEGAGIPGAFTPHALRHTFVTNLLRLGVPIHLVSELANHADLQTTMRYVKQGGRAVSDWLRNSTP